MVWAESLIWQDQAADDTGRRLILRLYRRRTFTCEVHEASDDLLGGGHTLEFPLVG